MKVFEIFLTEDKITGNDWQRLTDAAFKYEKEFSIEIAFDGNLVSFFLYASKELSHISTKIEGFLLKPLEKMATGEILPPTLFKLPSKKNILELKEDEEIRKKKTVESVRIRAKKILRSFFFFVTFISRDQKGNRFASSYITWKNPLVYLEIDFKNNLKFIKKSLPLFLKTDETSSLFKQSQENSFLEIDGFPHTSYPLYFPLTNFQFDKHTLIVGQTGVGKSKLIELLIKQIVKESPNEYTVLIVDPHSTLYPDFLNLNQPKLNFDFIHSSCNLFPALSESKIATELTILLFKTLLKDQFNAKLERVLKYSLFLLYQLYQQNKMSLPTLERFLTELEFRQELLNSLPEGSEFFTHFFQTEFPELQTKFYEIAIMPLLVLIDELNFIPAFSQNLPATNFESALKNNFLICFSLNRIFLGEKSTRLIAGLITQQAFLLAQKGFAKKIILVIDEVSLVENEGMIHILSEARKFNLSLTISQQYLTQITPELLKSILSNVFNYFVFKVSDEDAKILGKNLDIVFPEEVLKKEKEKGISEEELKRNLLVNLNPRKCLVRIFANNRFYPCFKAKTMEVA